VAVPTSGEGTSKKDSRDWWPTPVRGMDKGKDAKIFLRGHKNRRGPVGKGEKTKRKSGF